MRLTRMAVLPFVMVAVALGAASCATPAPPEPEPTATRSASSPSPSPSPTPTPTPSASAESDAALDWARGHVSDLTLEQKAAAVLMLHAPGTDPAPLRAYVDAGVSGLILMGDNVAGTPAEVAALAAGVKADPQAPILVAIDQEGGDVQRLPWDSAPGPSELRDAPVAATQEAFAARAATLAESGVSVNFGIVADVTGDPESFISGRVLGTEPSAAAERVAAAVTGELGVVMSTLKHFPGHGAAPGDSHSSVPTAPLTIDEWRAGPALPFAAGIDAGAELVMTGHLAYPAVDPAPASLSPEWHRILRDELGFDGVVVTDDMLMLQRNGLAEFADPGENAVRAIAAGGDLLLYVLPADPSEFGISVDGLVASIVSAVESGRIPESRLDEAAERVMELRRSLAH